MKFIAPTCNILCYQKTNSFASFMQIQIQAAARRFLLLVTRFFFFNMYTCIRLRRELHLPLSTSARGKPEKRISISCVCAATRPTSLFTSDTRLNSADRTLYIHGDNEPSTVRSPSWPRETRSCNTRASSLSLSLCSQGRTSLF